MESTEPLDENSEKKFKVGDKVRILLNLETLNPDEEDFLPWFNGKEGTVDSFYSDGRIVVKIINNPMDSWLMAFEPHELQRLEKES